MSRGNFRHDSMMGYVAKEEMPEYLSNLFRARRPLDPVPAMPKAKYSSVFPLQDDHRSLDQIFQEAKARHYAGDDGDFGRKNRETKEEKKLRIKQEQVMKAMQTVKKQRESWRPHNDKNAVATEPYRTIFVGRLCYETTEERLRREFHGVFGEVISVSIVKDEKTGKSRGYGFVEFNEEREADFAVRRGDGRKVDGRRIIVDRELGRTKANWIPRRLGGGKGESRRDRLDEELLREIKKQIDSEKKTDENGADLATQVIKDEQQQITTTNGKAENNKAQSPSALENAEEQDLRKSSANKADKERENERENLILMEKERSRQSHRISKRRSKSRSRSKSPSSPTPPMSSHYGDRGDRRYSSRDHRERSSSYVGGAPSHHRGDRDRDRDRGDRGDRDRDRNRDREREGRDRDHYSRRGERESGNRDGYDRRSGNPSGSMSKGDRSGARSYRSERERSHYDGERGTSRTQHSGGQNNTEAQGAASSSSQAKDPTKTSFYVSGSSKKELLAPREYSDAIKLEPATNGKATTEEREDGEIL